MKIKMSKHALNNLEEEMETDELQDFLDSLQKMADDGSFLEESEPVDMELLKVEEPEVYEELIKAMNESDIKLN